MYMYIHGAVTYMNHLYLNVLLLLLLSLSLLLSLFK